MQIKTTNTNEINVRAIITHIISGDGINKCRICMGDTKEGQVHLEETVMMDGDKAVTLLEVLEIVTGIEVVSDEDLPASLCSICAESALSAANFSLFCQQVTRQWKITIELLNSLPSGDESSVTAIINNNEVVIINEETFPVTNIHSKDDNCTGTNKINVSSKKLKCTECHKEFLHPFQLFCHLRGSLNNQACYICGDVMLRGDMVLHTAQSHNQIIFDCKKCPLLLLTAEQFEEHSKQAHPVLTNNSDRLSNTHYFIHKQEKCTNCDDVFINKPCFLYHIKNCHEQEKSQENTNSLNVTVGSVIKHTNKKSGNSNYSCICDYCGKSFAGKKFVSAHIQIVHLKNTHRPCLYCGKQLAAAHMTEHVKRHLSVQSYTCDKCGIVLKTKLGYIQHKRLHTGEKPYTCEHCGESFSASSRRSEHVRQKHNPEGVVLKHACTMCPARFRLPYRLQNHMLNVHKNTEVPKKKFKCSVCEEKFETRRGLLHHNRRKHQLPNILNKDNY